MKKKSTYCFLYCEQAHIQPDTLNCIPYTLQLFCMNYKGLIKPGIVPENKKEFPWI